MSRFLLVARDWGEKNTNFKSTYHLAQFVSRAALPFLRVTILILTAACSAVLQPSTTVFPDASQQASDTPQPIMTPTRTPRPTPGPPVGTDIHLELPEGDPERGKQLATRYQCSTCHVIYLVAPAFTSSDELPAIRERSEMRLSDPGYQGQATTPEEYLIESILLPEAFLVEGPWAHPMDSYYDQRMTARELADILAWLEEFK